MLTKRDSVIAKGRGVIVEGGGDVAVVLRGSKGSGVRHGRAILRHRAGCFVISKSGYHCQEEKHKVRQSRRSLRLC